MISINIHADPSFEKVGNAYKNAELRSFLHDVILKLAYSAESFSKQVTPVATGRLRASIGISEAISGLGAIVQTNVNYASFVHEGTRYMKARPFMQWGAEFAVQRWNGEIGPRLEDDLRKQLTAL